MQQHREAALHVGGAEPAQDFDARAAGRVAVRGHGVEVAAEHDARVPVPDAVRAIDVVRDPLDLETGRALAQPRFDVIRERAFGAADRRDRAEFLGERQEISHRGPVRRRRRARAGSRSA